MMPSFTPVLNNVSNAYQKKNKSLGIKIDTTLTRLQLEYKGSLHRHHVLINQIEA